MSIIRIANPDEIRPGHVVMIVVIVLALAGSCLLTSGARSMILPDGAREWPADSLFRALVELLNFNYTQPTPTGSEIKDLVFGLGTAIAVLSVGIAVAARPRGGEDLDESDTVITDPAAQTHVEETPDKRHVQPLFAAQILMLVYVGWSFASIGWSDAQDIALYGSLELALYTLWPFALAYGLSRASARFGAYALAAVAAAAAAMALGYTHVRNPTLRASYPIGNPTFLAACLIPGLLIALCVLVSQVRDFGNPRRVRRVVIALVCIGVAVLIGFAFRRAHARGAQVGLVCGILALFFFAWRKRGKLVVLAVAVVCGALATWVLLPRMTDYSPTGRDASLRLRSYAWSYAVELVGEHGLRGHGQGGYVRKADVLASGEDVLNDPEALTARIAHAHNEWLEVWTDLGSVGAVLVLGMLGFTLVAGAVAARSTVCVTRRWVLIALLASLTALIVEETFGVGLRVTGLPPVYYTVIGLIWAFSMPAQPNVIRALSRNGLTRGLSALIAAALAFVAAYLSVRDFQSARDQYEVAGAIDNLEWSRALELAGSAPAHRLSPQRRLIAQDLLCATYLHTARVHQVNGLRRAATAMQGEPYDQQLLAMADRDVEAAEFYRHRGTEVLQDLVRKAPNFYNSNWLQYGFGQIRAEFARARGDADAARKYDRDAAVALKRELARRPYDTNMARLYVIAAGSVISPDEIYTTLARPLRYNRVPVTYHDLVARLLTVPAFKAESLPFYERARLAAPTDDPERWDDPLAPETLRLAAVVWFEDGASDRAEASLEHACSLYAAFEPRFAYGAAACFAELAESRFLNDPVVPTRAIRDAEEAIRRAPPSYEGRQLVVAVRAALVGMQLAAGDEAAARDTLLELAPASAEATVELALSARYANLVTNLMRHDDEAHLGKLCRWLERAIELDVDNELAWFAKADIAFRAGDDDECVRCLREAHRRGAADAMIYQFVDIALRRRPTSKPLLDYSNQLAAEMHDLPGGPAAPGADLRPEAD